MLSQRPSRHPLCTALLLAAALGASSTAEAKRPRRPAPPPAQTPTPGRTPARSEVPPEAGPAALLASARALYDALEYDRVIPFAEALLARAEADIEQRLDAYLLQGSCLAIIGDPVEAEKPFRFLLRGRPDFDLPPETAPKILAVFRKVQVEERAIVEQLRELERARLVKELELSGGGPERAVGGRPLPFEFRLRDPRGVVAAVQLQYRRRGEPSFSSLALRRDESGAWRGALPGEWTASGSGFALEYFLTTVDAQERELLALAGAASPLELPVAPGALPDTRPLYRTGWFWAVTAATAVALGTAGYFAWDKSRELPATDLGVVELP